VRDNESPSRTKQAKHRFRSFVTSRVGVLLYESRPPGVWMASVDRCSCNTAMVNCRSKEMAYSVALRGLRDCGNAANTACANATTCEKVIRSTKTRMACAYHCFTRALFASFFSPVLPTPCGRQAAGGFYWRAWNTHDVPTPSTPLTIQLGAGATTSGLLDLPPNAASCLVLAHGAGAGMQHPFMAAIAKGLLERGVATLRFQFPYMEQGSKRPDSPKVAHAAVRAAVDEAARRVPGVPLFAGGKSFGGRMTTQAQAVGPLAGVRGIVLVGFPLHPAGKPSTARAAHLGEIKVPMLFLQGTRDALADLALIEQITASLGNHATLHIVQDADHSFHVPGRSGRDDRQVREELLETMARWMQALARPRQHG
jgi:predicted alpha/beta-hydrolase family hydrolase